MLDQIRERFPDLLDDRRSRWGGLVTPARPKKPAATTTTPKPDYGVNPATSKAYKMSPQGRANIRKAMKRRRAMKG